MENLGDFDRREQWGEFKLAGRTWHILAPGDADKWLTRRFDETVAKKEPLDVQIDAFFTAVLLPAEREAFVAMTAKGEGVSYRALTSVMQAISAAYTANPTGEEPAADSTPTRQRTGRKSAAGSSDRDKPRLRSAG